LTLCHCYAHTDHMARRMTHAEVGRALGVTESYASYLRNGKRMPSAPVLSRIVIRFNLDEQQTYALMKAYTAGAKELSVYLESVFPLVE
jgi:transcriptional regulator with XRE-family HTH domain